MKKKSIFTSKQLFLVLILCVMTTSAMAAVVSDDDGMGLRLGLGRKLLQCNPFMSFCDKDNIYDCCSPNFCQVGAGGIGVCLPQFVQYP